jgi:hypothetical protein
VFAHADLFASDGAAERLVATGDAILVPIGEPDAASQRSH